MHCRHCGAEVHEKAVVCVKCGVHPLNDNQFCQECGQPTNEKQEICTSCGCRLLRVSSSSSGSTDLVYPSSPPKSSGVATFLSCLIVGIGQMYLGQVKKGIVLLIGAIILSGITYGTLALPIWIAVMVDAYRIGRKLEQGQPVGQWEFF